MESFLVDSKNESYSSSDCLEFKSFKCIKSNHKLILDN